MSLVAAVGDDPAAERIAEQEVVREPAPPASVVDPTGAGDAFAAGLLAAWLAGAEAVTRPDARPLPRA